MIDIGANLAHDSFDHDREALLQRAWDAGVDAILVTGSSAASNEQALGLARTYPGRLYATAGLHPHHASEWDENLAARIAELSPEWQGVALGGGAWDHTHPPPPHPNHPRAFIAQLGLAVQADKPLFLHQRDAHADFHAILRDYRKAVPGAVVHCFTDTREALDAYLALDCHIGITGWICDERRGLGLRELVRHIPAERLLIETDAPYLLPRNLKPAPKHRRNEPAFLPWVLRGIAEARGEDAAALAAQTSANARSLFGLSL